MMIRFTSDFGGNRKGFKGEWSTGTKTFEIDIFMSDI